MKILPVLIFVFVSMYCLVRAQADTVNISNCTSFSQWCDTTKIIDIDCEELEELYLRYDNSTFDSPILSDKTHYQYVFVSLGSDPSGFLFKNGMKIDTLSYSGFIKERKMKLLNINMASLTLELLRVKNHWIHTRIIVESNVKIERIGFFGFYIDMRNAKELLKIDGLIEIGIRQRYITKRAKELLNKNGISVKILPDGPTYYP